MHIISPNALHMPSYVVTLQGVVAFVPSFAHCDQLYNRWHQTGMLTQLAAKKEVFREPRAATEVDSMLQRYADCISQASTQQAGIGKSLWADLMCKQKCVLSISWHQFCHAAALG